MTKKPGNGGIMLYLKPWVQDGDETERIDLQVSPPRHSDDTYGIVMGGKVIRLNCDSSLNIALDAFNSGKLDGILPSADFRKVKKLNPTDFSVNIVGLENGDPYWEFDGYTTWRESEPVSVTTPKVIIPKETYLKTLPTFGEF